MADYRRGATTLFRNQARAYRTVCEKRKQPAGIVCPSVAPVVWGRYNSKPNLNPKLQLTWFAFKTL